MSEEHYRPNSKIWHCKYCNEEFHSRRKLFAHCKICSIKESLPKDSLGRIISQDHYCTCVCEFCGLVTKTKSSYAQHKRTCKLNPDRVPGKSHPQSEETKKKLSEAAIRNLEHGKHNHYVSPSIKLSYAEQYFFDCFTNNGLQFANNVWVGKYCLDFVVGNNYFEVDGDQHYTEDGLIKDGLRTEYLKDLGMNLIGRCRWSAFQTLSDNDKYLYVKDVTAKLQSGEYVDPLQFVNSLKHNAAHNSIRVLKNTIKDLVKLKSLMKMLDSIESGKIRSDGHIDNRMISYSQWESFRDAILNSGVDLTKFGWVGKVVCLTGLSKKIIRKTVRRFNIGCFERSHE